MAITKYIKVAGLIAGAVALTFFLIKLFSPLPGSAQEFFDRITSNLHLLIASVIGLSIGLVL
ncbi:MAG: hypothetical protein QW727_04510 [Candidatus Pacearchaeota archaeon]